MVERVAEAAVRVLEWLWGTTGCDTSTTEMRRQIRSPSRLPYRKRGGSPAKPTCLNEEL